MIEVPNFRLQATKNIGFSKKYSVKPTSARKKASVLKPRFLRKRRNNGKLNDLTIIVLVGKKKPD